MELLPGAAVVTGREAEMTAEILKFPISGTSTYQAAIEALVSRALLDAIQWSQQQEPGAFSMGSEANLVFVVANIAADMLDVAALRLRKEALSVQFSRPQA